MIFKYNDEEVEIPDSFVPRLIEEFSTQVIDFSEETRMNFDLNYSFSWSSTESGDSFWAKVFDKDYIVEDGIVFIEQKPVVGKKALLKEAPEYEHSKRTKELPKDYPIEVTIKEIFSQGKLNFTLTEEGYCFMYYETLLTTL